MKVLFAAGHVLGAKVWMGYNEDLNMFDLARRKARYAQETYEVETTTFYVTNTSYYAVQKACTGCDIASFEHSNAEAAPVKGKANRVTVYRTISNPGDGPCLKIAQATAPILNTVAYPVAHRKNKDGGDYYGVLGRAMKAGCDDAYLIEHGFHTHTPTREKLLDPDVRQQIAQAEVDVMATHYGWIRKDEDMLKRGDKGYAVGAWQRSLIDWNPAALPKYKDDLSFGPETEEWTNKFKLFAAMLADGMVDDDTWGTMGDYLRTHSDEMLLQAEIAGLKKANEILAGKLDVVETDVASKTVELIDAADAFRTLKETADKYP